MSRADRLEHEARVMWAALDRLAARRGVSLTALGVEAGFPRLGSPSRHRDPRKAMARFPGMRTVSHLLHHCGLTWLDFAALIAEAEAQAAPELRDAA